MPTNENVDDDVPEGMRVVVIIENFAIIATHSEHYVRRPHVIKGY